MTHSAGCSAATQLAVQLPDSLPSPGAHSRLPPILTTTSLRTRYSTATPLTMIEGQRRRLLRTLNSRYIYGSIVRAPMESQRTLRRFFRRQTGTDSAGRNCSLSYTLLSSSSKWPPYPSFRASSTLTMRTARVSSTGTIERGMPADCLRPVLTTMITNAVRHPSARPALSYKPCSG